MMQVHQPGRRTQPGSEAGRNRWQAPLARSVRASAALLAMLFLVAPFSASAQEPPAEIERVVRLSVRVEGDGRDARIELPLVQSDEHQTLVSEELQTRGFAKDEVVRDGNRLAILTLPKFKGAKRITYEFRVKTRRTTKAVPPAPVGKGDPSGEDAVWLRPTLRLQSTSPLIREKLIRYATPRLAEGETDAIRIAWDLTRTYERRPDGSRTVLKATRVGHASDRGLDRLFATFLRTSGVPSRTVNGVDVARKRGKRFTTWVEVKTGGEWVPMSVPRDGYGELPAGYVKLSHGDRPLIVSSGLKSSSFRWKISRPGKTKEARR